MKEHGGKHPAEVPATAKTLKSSLKKPGSQSKGKTRKNRVVINEKLNEFFAADYIILIKEECCADYEEDCDCCCQEHELIRLGSCKECRAELNLHFAGVAEDDRYGKEDEEDEDEIARERNRGRRFDESCRQDDDEDDEIGEEEGEDDDEEEDEEDEVDAARDDNNVSKDSVVVAPSTPTPPPPPPPPLPPRHEQHETLSPPEGYKDVCDGNEDEGGDDGSGGGGGGGGAGSVAVGSAGGGGEEDADEQSKRMACTECDRYHRAATGLDVQSRINGPTEETQDNRESTEKINEERLSNSQTTPTEPTHHRYLVETITMTTVTERRIVRELSEEEEKSSSTERERKPRKDDIPAVTARPTVDGAKQAESYDDDVTKERNATEERTTEKPITKEEETENAEREKSPDSQNTPKETTDLSELSLTFKLGNVSLATNSLKPNSAVRQLFPDSRFISPPPAPVKSISSSTLDEDPDDPDSDTRDYLGTDSLRSRISGSRGDSSDSEQSSTKRTMERNTLRRSLIGKYNTTSRKKNLRSKDLSLEERIRQLTCVDQDEERSEGDNSESSFVTQDADRIAMNEFPVRTSPSGEEQPSSERISTQNVGTITSLPMSTATTTVAVTTVSVATMTTTTATSTTNFYGHNILGVPALPIDNPHNQSTYRKITDLFAHKKNVEHNMPDLGIGNGTKSISSKEYSSKNSIAKMTSEGRRQFLASLAPLSCVAASSADSQEDYYRNERNAGSNRDSVGYNSDSSYSLEDIEAALNGDDRNYVPQPDVTRGTPTGNRSDDNTTDELLAFVEQDKSRMERIKRRYEAEDRYAPLNGNAEEEKNTSTVTNDENKNGNNQENEDDDDEFNDYGFNRRPSVRGIKPRSETDDDVLRRLRPRSLPPNNFEIRTNYQSSWPIHYNKADGKIDPSNPIDGDFAVDSYGTLIKDNRDIDTLDRINTMQKRIDDIYQTIAESAGTVRTTFERGTYMENAFTRPLVRVQPSDGLDRTYQQKPGGQRYFPEVQHQPSHIRTLRIAGGASGDETPPPQTAMYTNSLPKIGRYPAVTLANYHCNATGTPLGGNATKCYRTMYFVPYNGLSDPTYQNIQRILPPHSSPNYATHIERYPYPRQTKTTQPQQPQPQQARYYPRPGVPGVPGVPQTSALPPGNPSMSNTIFTQTPAQQTLHLHLHHHQPEDFGLPNVALSSVVPHGTVHPVHLQHHQHHQHHRQIASYHVQPVPPAPPPPSSYAIITPARCAPAVTGSNPTYHYQVNDTQSQTVCSPASVPTVPLKPADVPGEPLLTTTYGVVPAQPAIGNVTSSSSSSSSPAPPSPTKQQQLLHRHHLHHHLQQQQHAVNSCSVAERGVPEGAASAPTQDCPQPGSTSASHILQMSNTYVGHRTNDLSPPTNTQNSVYYAMNV